MKTKFIGLEGFNEIESLSTKKNAGSRRLTKTQKTIRFVKRAGKLCIKKLKYFSINTSKAFSSALSKKSNAKSKPQVSVLEKRYNENRSGVKSEYSSSAIDAVTGLSFNGKRHAHSAPAHRAHTVIKKKAILAIVACTSAIILSCVTVASALDYDGKMLVSLKPANTVESTEPSQGMVLNISTADEALGNISENAYSAISNTIILENANPEFAALFIDGKFIGATNEIDELRNALDGILYDARKDYDDETTTEFANNVEIKSGCFPESEILSAAELVDKADGKFSIALSTDIVYTREISFDTEIEYDENEYSSYEEVKTKGVNGEELVTIRTTFVDGIQTDAVETGTKTLKKAVNEVVVKGSANGISYDDSSSSYSSGASGSFIWPLPYTHYITSNFEWRWGRMHNGLDIAAGGVYGQSIIASDGGTVVFSGNDGGGYGNYVIIDHGNGYSTVYAHCSSLAVSSGQYVSQGETLAYVGSTGFSTGPHLHFEIRVNDAPQNPLNYVS